ncbi:MAG: biosynthetic-type acetolactate synthase large subunit [Oscillospiraceae bacterium]|nr:biosynthetic-type acetolactate synthase large subunit [Oscillospiraceae bacterium]
MLLSGADILVECLIEQGCETVFGYPGGQILNVYDSLYTHQDRITHILTAHEQGAAHAADGYARVTGKVGVVISTSGPGATNLVTGIANAYLDSVPLVAICGNVTTAQIGSDSFQEIDITGVTLPITKHNYFVGSVEELADVVREAFLLARSGRPGPVLIDIPKDVQIAKCEYEPQETQQEVPKSAAKDIRIEEAAALLNAAKRPFIYFGGGVIAAGAQAEMLETAEKLDAPLGCSLMGLSAVPTDHPRFLGMQGMHGHYASSMAMHHADLILSLGVRFNDRVTGNRQKFAVGAKIVHIDVDGSELSKTVNAACGLRGDVKFTLQKLLTRLDNHPKPQWQEEIAAFRRDEECLLDKRTGMTPRNVICEINTQIGANTAVCTDVGQHQMWAAQNLSFKTPRRFVSSGGLGTMGFGFGAAIGAAIGTRERSVLITGDGSFGMNLNELMTAVRYNIPVTVVIMDNGVLGMVRQWQTLFFNRHYSNTVLDRGIDYGAFARAFGADGETAESTAELNAALNRSFAREGPYIIDCKIDKDEFVLPMLPPGGSMDDIITRLEVKA